jgi:predicted nucleotidyltransferase
MDKINAVKLGTTYLRRVRERHIKFSEAWLFGSYVKGNQHDNSDIDIAIVLDESEKKTFDIEVKLMVIREGEETIIEPHAFTKDEFDVGFPIINQIVKYGERLNI